MLNKLIGGLLLGVRLIGLLRGLLLRLLLGLLLRGLLLRLLLLLDLRRGLLTVVIVVAAADQGQTGGADAGAGGCSEQRATRHLSPAHPLPIVSLAHAFPPAAGRSRR